MHDKLPQIYWYLFWIGFVILAFRMAYLGGKHGFDAKMKALEILKMYAEKGAEPPQGLVEQLTDKAFQRAPAPAGREGSHGFLHAFVGFLFMACASWGVHEWLTGHSQNAWAGIASQAAFAFFSFGAFGFLLAALFTRNK
jgi:hypothetical protein